MKQWRHIVAISLLDLETRLNTLSKQGYKIFKLWKNGHNNYEIIAFIEVMSKDRPSLEGNPDCISLGEK